MASSGTAASLVRRRGFMKKTTTTAGAGAANNNSNNNNNNNNNNPSTNSTNEQLLKQQKIEKHMMCNVCTKIPYPGTESLIPLIAEQDGYHNQNGADFDAGIYAYIYHMNSPTELFGIPNRVDDETANKTKERCSRHALKLQNELIKANLMPGGDSSNSNNRNTSTTSELEREDRTIAPFDIDEIQLGSLLGTGGFSSVFEVASFHPTRELSDGLTVHEQNCRQYLADNVLGPIDFSMNDEIYPSRKGKSNSEGGRTVSRYAIKHLRKALVKDPEKFERAAIDLVLEAQLLLAMSHPNIITMRGCSIQGVNGFLSGKHNTFFIIIDRLPVTLENRIFQWRAAIRKHRSRLKMPWSRQKSIAKLDNILLDRVQVARDIASALEYMHERRIIYRDLKATNIGFDVYGELKIFDFGLTRLLPTKVNEEAYLMSRVGTKYYMAPEVRKKLPYNLSADIYSYGVCLWEIMSLGSPREVLRKMKEDSYMEASSLSPTASTPLPICKCWPEDVRQVTLACLSIGPIHRPNIANVRYVLDKLMERLGGKPPLPHNTRMMNPSTGGGGGGPGGRGRSHHFRGDRTVAEHTSQATSDYYPESQHQVSEDSKHEIVLSEGGVLEGDMGPLHHVMRTDNEVLLERISTTTDESPRPHLPSSSTTTKETILEANHDHGTTEYNHDQETQQEAKEEISSPDDGGTTTSTTSDSELEVAIAGHDEETNSEHIQQSTELTTIDSGDESPNSGSAAPD
ncbi:hypothetical protein ACA910_002486 [Epithemia clementina (nom. ined.)]